MIRRILVTGGTGYIGSRLAEILALKGHRVTVFGRHQPVPGRATWHSMMEGVWTGDISDPAVFDRFASRSFDTMIHLIAVDHQLAETGDDVLSVNTVPTWRLLRHCERHGVDRLIYFSTERVLGSTAGGGGGSRRAKPENQHGLSPYLSEEIVAFFNEHSKVAGINLRLSNTYGRPVFDNGNVWKYAANQMCRQAYCEGRIVLRSDGSALRDLIHLDDVCRAASELIETPFPDLIYSISSGRILSIFEVARTIGKVYLNRYGQEIPLLLPADDGSGKLTDADGRNGNNNSVSQVTSGRGIEKAISLESGIDDLFQYLEVEMLRG